MGLVTCQKKYWFRTFVIWPRALERDAGARHDDGRAVVRDLACDLRGARRCAKYRLRDGVTDYRRIMVMVCTKS